MGRPRLVAADERPDANERAVMLSIVMPVYNEQRTIARAVVDVLNADLPCPFELIIVNDGSTDGTGAILDGLDHPRARVVNHPRNVGKGAALQTGAALANGTHLVPFDADLEYDPADLARMLEPVMRGRCDVVYGVRLSGANTRYQSYVHALSNRALTLATSVIYNASLTDIHTCLKLVPVALFRDLALTEGGFGLDTELTARILARGLFPFEVPVSYYSRSVAQGKKITWRDGVECVQVLARVRASARRERAGRRAVEEPFDAVDVAVRLLTELEVGDDHVEPEIVHAHAA